MYSDQERSGGGPSRANLAASTARCEGRPEGRRHYALVIGNNDYDQVNSLSKCVNDAKDMGAALQAAGYQVGTLQSCAHCRQQAHPLSGRPKRFAIHQCATGCTWAVAVSLSGAVRGVR